MALGCWRWQKLNGKADRRTALSLTRVGTCSPKSSILPTDALHPNRLDDHFSCQNDLISNACHWHAFFGLSIHTRAQHNPQPDAGCQLIVAVAIRSVVRFHLPSLYPRCFRKAFLTALFSVNCRGSQPVVRTFCPLESVMTKSFRRCQFRQSGITASIRAHKKPKSNPSSLDASMQDHSVTLCTRDVKTVKDTLIVNRRPIGPPDRHPRGTPSFCVSND